MLTFFQFAGTVPFVKQKTAYEISRSDWSSDVCSSDLNYRAIWQGQKDLNPRHVVLETTALPLSLIHILNPHEVAFTRT